jgi:hypothetical protein
MGMEAEITSIKFDLSLALDVPVTFFYEEMSDATRAATPSAMIHGHATKPAHTDLDPMAKRETLELVRAYYDIEDVDIRRRVVDLAKALGSTPPNTAPCGGVIMATTNQETRGPRKRTTFRAGRRNHARAILKAKMHPNATFRDIFARLRFSARVRPARYGLSHGEKLRDSRARNGIGRPPHNKKFCK